MACGSRAERAAATAAERERRDGQTCEEQSDESGRRTVIPVVDEKAEHERLRRQRAGLIAALSTGSELSVCTQYFCV